MTLDERNAVVQYIESALRTRFPSGTMPTPNEIKEALAEIVATAPYPKIVVEPDPDVPGAVRLTAPIDMLPALGRALKYGIAIDPVHSEEASRS